MTLLATQAAACRLALVLAMDVSSSVDAAEDSLQRGGLAAALLAPDVQEAFFISPAPVALAVFEWSGRYNQSILFDWTLIETPADLQAAASRIRASTRSQTEFPTSLGYALGYAATMLQRAPRCAAQTVDVAGDGVNNDGFGPSEAYGAFPFQNTIVNGLVIETEDTNTPLAAYYRAEVIRGPGSFVEIAKGFEDYTDAMRRKLIRELGVIAIGDAGQPAPGEG